MPQAIPHDVKIWFVGDDASKDSVLIECQSLNVAKTYLRDWLQAHSYKAYPYKKDSNIPNRYNSKFACVYIVRHTI